MQQPSPQSKEPVCGGKLSLRADYDDGRQFKLDVDFKDHPKPQDTDLNQHDEKLFQWFKRVDWYLRPYEAAIAWGLILHMRATPTSNACPEPEHRVRGILASIFGDTVSIEQSASNFRKKIETSIASKQKSRIENGLPPIVFPDPLPDRGLEQVEALFQQACASSVADFNQRKTDREQAQADARRFSEESAWLADRVRLLYRTPAWLQWLVTLFVPEIFSQERMPDSLKKKIPASQRRRAD